MSNLTNPITTESTVHLFYIIQTWTGQLMVILFIPSTSIHVCPLVISPVTWLVKYIRYNLKSDSLCWEMRTRGKLLLQCTARSTVHSGNLLTDGKYMFTTKQNKNTLVSLTFSYYHMWLGCLFFSFTDLQPHPNAIMT